MPGIDTPGRACGPTSGAVRDARGPEAQPVTLPPGPGSPGSTWAPWALPAIVALSVLLRLPCLTERSLWYDEASSWQTAKFPLDEMMRSVRLNVHLPLYYMMLKGWLAIFGESAAALRGFSITCGALTVFLMALIGRAIYPLTAAGAGPGSADESGRDRGARRFGALLAVLVAVSPYQVLASIEARMYALGTALTALAAWLLTRILRGRDSIGAWAAFGLACIGLLYTHHFGLLSVASFFLYLLLLAVWEHGAGAGARARALALRGGAAASPSPWPTCRP
jgi:mannosyltransferase